MNKNYLAAALSLTLLLGSSLASATEYIIDTVHSDVSFKIRHMVVSKTTGRFAKFTGSFVYDDKDAQTWSANAVIDATSIDTNNTDRDAHLRGADFFEVEKYPELTFRSTKVSDVVGNKAKLHGFLKMHGVEKLVVLDLEIGGTVKDPWGNMRAGFEASTTINRQDFGINYNKTLDAGGLALSNEVEISIRVEGIEKKAEAPKAATPKKK